MQAATATLTASVEGLRGVLAPREYAIVLDLHRRWLDRELARNERGLRRWAA